MGLEHFRSLTPSTLVLGYSIFKLVADVLIRRTYGAVGLSNAAGGEYLGFFVSANVSAYYLLIVVEVTEKRRLFNSTYAVRQVPFNSYSYSLGVFDRDIPKNAQHL